MNRLTCYFRSDFADLARIYQDRLESMNRFAAAMRARVEAVLDEAGVAGARVECRVKSLESFLEKVLRKNLNNPFTDCVDLIGLRVVYPFGEDRDAIERAVSDRFEVLERYDKRQEQGYKVFAYTALHLHLLHEGRVFELQFRTLIQDTWSQIDTLLFYKTGDTVPPAIRRKMNRLLALFEIADDEFQSLRDEVREFVRGHARASDEAMRAMPLDLMSLEVYQRKAMPALRFLREHVDAAVGVMLNRGLRTVGEVEALLSRTEEPRRRRAKEMPEHADRFDFHLFAALAEGAAARPAQNGKRNGAAAG